MSSNSSVTFPGFGRVPTIAVDPFRDTSVPPGFGSDDEEPIFLSPILRRLRHRAGLFGYGGGSLGMLSALTFSGLGSGISLSSVRLPSGHANSNSGNSISTMNDANDGLGTGGNTSTTEQQPRRLGLLDLHSRVQAVAQSMSPSHHGSPTAGLGVPGVPTHESSAQTAVSSIETEEGYEYGLRDEHEENGAEDEEEEEALDDFEDDDTEQEEELYTEYFDDEDEYNEGGCDTDSGAESSCHDMGRGAATGCSSGVQDCATADSEIEAAGENARDADRHFGIGRLPTSGISISNQEEGMERGQCANEMDQLEEQEPLLAAHRAAEVGEMAAAAAAAAAAARSRPTTPSTVTRHQAVSSDLQAAPPASIEDGGMVTAIALHLEEEAPSSATAVAPVDSALEPHLGTTSGRRRGRSCAFAWAAVRLALSAVLVPLRLAVFLAGLSPSITAAVAGVARRQRSGLSLDNIATTVPPAGDGRCRASISSSRPQAAVEDSSQLQQAESQMTQQDGDGVRDGSGSPVGLPVQPSVTVPSNAGADVELAAGVEAAADVAGIPAVLSAPVTASALQAPRISGTASDAGVASATSASFNPQRQLQPHYMQQIEQQLNGGAQSSPAALSVASHSSHSLGVGVQSMVVVLPHSSTGCIASAASEAAISPERSLVTCQHLNGVASGVDYSLSPGQTPSDSLPMEPGESDWMSTVSQGTNARSVQASPNLEVAVTAAIELQCTAASPSPPPSRDFGVCVAMGEQGRLEIAGHLASDMDVSPGVDLSPERDGVVSRGQPAVQQLPSWAPNPQSRPNRQLLSPESGITAGRDGEHHQHRTSTAPVAAVMHSIAGVSPLIVAAAPGSATDEYITPVSSADECRISTATGQCRRLARPHAANAAEDVSDGSNSLLAGLCTSHLPYDMDGDADAERSDSGSSLESYSDPGISCLWSRQLLDPDLEQLLSLAAIRNPSPGDAGSASRVPVAVASSYRMLSRGGSRTASAFAASTASSTSAPARRLEEPGAGCTPAYVTGVQRTSLGCRVAAWSNPQALPRSFGSAHALLRVSNLFRSPAVPPLLPGDRQPQEQQLQPDSRQHRVAMNAGMAQGSALRRYDGGTAFPAHSVMARCAPLLLMRGIRHNNPLTSERLERLLLRRAASMVNLRIEALESPAPTGAAPLEALQGPALTAAAPSEFPEVGAQAAEPEASAGILQIRYSESRLLRLPDTGLQVGALNVLSETAERHASTATAVRTGSAAADCARVTCPSGWCRGSFSNGRPSAAAGSGSPGSGRWGATNGGEERYHRVQAAASQPRGIPPGMAALALQTAMPSEDDESVCINQGEGWRQRNSLGLDDGRWARRLLRQAWENFRDDEEHDDRQEDSRGCVQYYYSDDDNTDYRDLLDQTSCSGTSRMGLSFPQINQITFSSAFGAVEDLRHGEADAGAPLGPVRAVLRDRWAAHLPALRMLLQNSRIARHRAVPLLPLAGGAEATASHASPQQQATMTLSDTSSLSIPPSSELELVSDRDSSPSYPRRTAMHTEQEVMQEEYLQQQQQQQQRCRRRSFCQQQQQFDVVDVANSSAVYMPTHVRPISTRPVCYPRELPSDSAAAVGQQRLGSTGEERKEGTAHTDSGVSSGQFETAGEESPTVSLTAASICSAENTRTLAAPPQQARGASSVGSIGTAQLLVASANPGTVCAHVDAAEERRAGGHGLVLQAHRWPLVQSSSAEDSELEEIAVRLSPSCSPYTDALLGPSSRQIATAAAAAASAGVSVSGEEGAAEGSRLVSSSAPAEDDADVGVGRLLSIPPLPHHEDECENDSVVEDPSDVDRWVQGALELVSDSVSLGRSPASSSLPSPRRWVCPRVEAPGVVPSVRGDRVPEGSARAMQPLLSVDGDGEDRAACNAAEASSHGIGSRRCEDEDVAASSWRPGAAYSWDSGINLTNNWWSQPQQPGLSSLQQSEHALFARPSGPENGGDEDGSADMPPPLWTDDDEIESSRESDISDDMEAMPPLLYSESTGAGCANEGGDSADDSDEEVPLRLFDSEVDDSDEEVPLRLFDSEVDEDMDIEVNEDGSSAGVGSDPEDYTTLLPELPDDLEFSTERPSSIAEDASRSCNRLDSNETVGPDEHDACNLEPPRLGRPRHRQPRPAVPRRAGLNSHSDAISNQSEAGLPDLMSSSSSEERLLFRSTEIRDRSRATRLIAATIAASPRQAAGLTTSSATRALPIVSSAAAAATAAAGFMSHLPSADWQQHRSSSRGTSLLSQLPERPSPHSGVDVSSNATRAGSFAAFVWNRGGRWNDDRRMRQQGPPRRLRNNGGAFNNGVDSDDSSSGPAPNLSMESLPGPGPGARSLSSPPLHDADSEDETGVLRPSWQSFASSASRRLISSLRRQETSGTLVRDATAASQRELNDLAMPAARRTGLDGRASTSTSGRSTEETTASTVSAWSATLQALLGALIDLYALDGLGGNNNGGTGGDGGVGSTGGGGGGSSGDAIGGTGGGNAMPPSLQPRSSPGSSLMAHLEAAVSSNGLLRPRAAAVSGAGGGSSAGAGQGVSSGGSPRFSVVHLSGSTGTSTTTRAVLSITINSSAFSTRGSGGGSGGDTSFSRTSTGTMPLHVGSLSSFPPSWRSYLPIEDTSGRHPNDEPGLPGTYDEQDIPAWATRFAPPRVLPSQQPQSAEAVVSAFSAAGTLASEWPVAAVNRREGASSAVAEASVSRVNELGGYTRSSIEPSSSRDLWENFSFSFDGSDSDENTRNEVIEEDGNEEAMDGVYPRVAVAVDSPHSDTESLSESLPDLIPLAAFSTAAVSSSSAAVLPYPHGAPPSTQSAIAPTDMSAAPQDIILHRPAPSVPLLPVTEAARWASWSDSQVILDLQGLPDHDAANVGRGDLSINVRNAPAIGGGEAVTASAQADARNTVTAIDCRHSAASHVPHESQHLPGGSGVLMLAEQQQTEEGCTNHRGVQESGRQGEQGAERCDNVDRVGSYLNGDSLQGGAGDTSEYEEVPSVLGGFRRQPPSTTEYLEQQRLQVENQVHQNEQLQWQLQQQQQLQEQQQLQQQHWNSELGLQEGMAASSSFAADRAVPMEVSSNIWLFPPLTATAAPLPPPQPDTLPTDEPRAHTVSRYVGPRAVDEEVDGEQVDSALSRLAEGGTAQGHAERAGSVAEGSRPGGFQAVVEGAAEAAEGMYAPFDTVPARRNAVTYPREGLLGMLGAWRNAETAADLELHSGEVRGGGSGIFSVVPTDSGGSVRLMGTAGIPGTRSARSASHIAAAAALLRDSAFVDGLLAELQGVATNPPSWCVVETQRMLAELSVDPGVRV